MSALNPEERTDPPARASERETLEGWLNFHRLTLRTKCAGLSDTQRKQRPVPTSLLSLRGLVRHLTVLERNWFGRALSSEAELPPIYPGASAWDLLEDADWESDANIWHAEVEYSRQLAASREIDDVGSAMRGGQRSGFWLRWIYGHVIGDYARHNGHADLLRELIDGEVGV